MFLGGLGQALGGLGPHFEALRLLFELACWAGWLDWASRRACWLSWLAWLAGWGGQDSRTLPRGVVI